MSQFIPSGYHLVVPKNKVHWNLGHEMGYGIYLHLPNLAFFHFFSKRITFSIPGCNYFWLRTLFQQLRGGQKFIVSKRCLFPTLIDWHIVILGKHVFGDFSTFRKRLKFQFFRRTAAILHTWKFQGYQAIPDKHARANPWNEQRPRERQFDGNGWKQKEMDGNWWTSTETGAWVLEKFQSWIRNNYSRYENPSGLRPVRLKNRRFSQQTDTISARSTIPCCKTGHGHTTIGMCSMFSPGSTKPMGLS